jgi:DNA-binding NarL/FixJ family response regulator
MLYKIRHHHIDLVMLLHDDDAVSIKQLVAGIKKAYPDLPIAYVQPDRDVKKAKEVEKAGVHVYLYKMSALNLIDSLHDVAQKYAPQLRSRSVFLPEPDFKLSSGIPSNPFSLLSEHQKKILCLLADGVERHQIASRCNLSIHTINKYVQVAKEKFGCTQTKELLALCTHDIKLAKSKKENSHTLPIDINSRKGNPENTLPGTGTE